MKWNCKKYCKQYIHCQEPCDVIAKQLKDKGLRELLPPPDISSIHRLDRSSNPPYSIGYKDVLQANIEARRDYMPTTIKEVRSIHDIRLRAIASMAYANISISDIASLLNYSKNHIYKLVNK